MPLLSKQKYSTKLGTPSRIKSFQGSIPIKHEQPASLEFKWLLIYTKSRFEKKLYDALIKAGFNAFLPLVKTKRRWSDRIKSIKLPLFPNYVFVRTSRAQTPDIYLYPGFVRFVSFEGRPCEIREEEIDLLDKIVTHGYEVQSSGCCNVGDRVKITRGSLYGWEGKVQSMNGKTHITFHFEQMQQAISVVVAAADVEKVRED